MQNELRQNPRFVSKGGVNADMVIAGREVTGKLQNFSSSGFAIVLHGGFDTATQQSLEVAFDSGAGEMRISAVVCNQSSDGEHTRIGCRIVDMHGHADAYFAFLTQMMFSQGMIASMATKPVKCRPPAGG